MDAFPPPPPSDDELRRLMQTNIAAFHRHGELFEMQQHQISKMLMVRRQSLVAAGFTADVANAIIIQRGLL